MDVVTARYRLARRPGRSRVADNDNFALEGGLNLVDPPLLTKPGQLLACKNYEPGPRSGYRRIKGHERFDGHTAPSAAVYWLQHYTRATSIAPVGATLIGRASGDTGVVLDVVESTPVTINNLLRHSSALDDTSAWTHLGCTIPETNIPNPIDGTPSAEFMAETNALMEHGSLQIVAKDTVARRYWFSVYARPRGGASSAALRAFFSAAQVLGIFDFSIGAAYAVEDNGDYIGHNEYMERLENGWWRIGIQFTANVQIAVNCEVLSVAPGGNPIFTGNPTSGIELYGFQLEETTADSIAPSTYVDSDTFSRGNGAGYYVLARPTGTYLDDERLQSLEAPLPNGGFEQGTLASWWLTEHVTVVANNAHSGLYQARCECWAQGLNLVSAPWAVVTGDVVKLVVYVRRDETSVPSIAATLEVRTYNSSLGAVGIITLASASTGVSGWQRLAGEYTIPVGVTYATLCVNSGIGSGFWFADDAVYNATHAQAEGTAQVDAANTDELHAQYKRLARDDARALILAVPGSGPTHVAVYHGKGYALRNNAGGTAGVFYKSTASGWAAIAMGRKLRFTGGLPAGITESVAVTGVTSGATGIVRRVVVQTGAFTSSDAVGYLILPSVTGTFQNGENLQIAGTTRAVANGADAAQTLAPNGHLETRVHNFYGHASTERLYGVDGANRAFEYQDLPEFYAQIDTGMTFDTPTHLAIHKNQLFLSFSGGSLQRSAVGDPLNWTTISLGAAEMAIGAEITGLLEEIGAVLFVFARHATKYVAGDASNYAVENFSYETGAHEWSIQRIGQGIYLDDRGLTSLAQTQKYGNYLSNSFSSQVQPLVEELRRSAVTASCVVRNKSLCRLFFGNGRFLSIGVDGSKISGITSGDIGRVVRSAVSGEDLDGNEMILFGSDDGYVYRMESGTSFDGNMLQAFLRTLFHFSGTPIRRKRYRRAAFQIKTEGATTLKIGADYSFADPKEAADYIRTLDMEGGGGLWDVGQWNEFQWSTGLATEASIKIDASGYNIGFLVSHEADDEDDHTLHSVLLRVSVRRTQRGASHG